MFQASHQPPDLSWVNGTIDEAIDLLAQRRQEGMYKHALVKAAQGDSILPAALSQYSAQIPEALKWSLGGAALGGALGLGSEYLTGRRKKRPFTGLLTGGLLGGLGGLGGSLLYQNLPALQNLFKGKPPTGTDLATMQRAEEIKQQTGAATVSDKELAAARAAAIDPRMVREWGEKVKEFGPDIGTSGLMTKLRAEAAKAGEPFPLAGFHATPEVAQLVKGLMPAREQAFAGYFPRHTAATALPAGQEYFTAEAFEPALTDEAARAALMQRVAQGQFVRGTMDGTTPGFAPVTAEEIKKRWPELEKAMKFKDYYYFYQPEREKQIRNVLATLTQAGGEQGPTARNLERLGSTFQKGQDVRSVAEAGQRAGGAAWSVKNLLGGKYTPGLTTDIARTMGMSPEELKGSFGPGGRVTQAIAEGSLAPLAAKKPLTEATYTAMAEKLKPLPGSPDPLDVIRAAAKGEEGRLDLLDTLEGLPKPGKPGEKWTRDEIEQALPTIYKAVGEEPAATADVSGYGGVLPYTPTTLVGGTAVLDLVGRRLAAKFPTGQQLKAFVAAASEKPSMLEAPYGINKPTFEMLKNIAERPDSEKIFDAMLKGRLHTMVRGGGFTPELKRQLEGAYKLKPEQAAFAAAHGEAFTPTLKAIEDAQKTNEKNIATLLRQANDAELKGKADLAAKHRASAAELQANIPTVPPGLEEKLLTSDDVASMAYRAKLKQIFAKSESPHLKRIAGITDPAEFAKAVRAYHAGEAKPLPGFTTPVPWKPALEQIQRAARQMEPVPVRRPSRFFPEAPGAGFAGTRMRKYSPYLLPLLLAGYLTGYQEPMPERTRMVKPSE